MTRHPYFLFFALACGALGCAADLGSPTQAELRAPAGDATSCASAHDANGCGPAILCSGTFAACADVGCAPEGLVVVVYPDGSWRAPDPGAGAWSVERISDVRVRLTFGDQSMLVAERGSPAYDACQ